MKLKYGHSLETDGVAKRARQSIHLKEVKINYMKITKCIMIRKGFISTVSL